MKGSGSRYIRLAGGCPGVCARMISAASIIIAGVGASAPDNHFIASPHRRVASSSRWCLSRTSGCPHIHCRIVSSAGAVISPTPDDHFSTCPNRCVLASCRRCVHRTRHCPTVRGGVVSRASIRIARPIVSAPDDHFAASPNCGVTGSPGERTVCGQPAVGLGIVSSTTIRGDVWEPVATCRCNWLCHLLL